MKGPYIQLGLPFRTGTGGQRFFDDFRDGIPSYMHQETAWQRL